MSQHRTTSRPSTAARLELVRGAFGALQLATPGLVGGRLLGRPLDARARAVIRILGARQVAQALASGSSPTYPVLALGAEVDVLHASSMIALGILDRRRRTTALLDGLIAGSFAAAGVLAAQAASNTQQPGPASAWGALRDRWASRLAVVLVPGYATRFPADRRSAG